MKKIFTVFMILLLILTGCNNGTEGLDRAMTVRQNLQQKACSFEAEITADYGDQVYTFVMLCNVIPDGDLEFTVSSPETIQGITGIIDGTGGKLTFDDTVLAFELLADGQITPVSAPWILIRTLRSGYIHAVQETDTGLKLVIDDSYEDDSLQLDIWLNAEDIPREAEILWQGRRIVSIKVNNFSYM